MKTQYQVLKELLQESRTALLKFTSTWKGFPALRCGRQYSKDIQTKNRTGRDFRKEHYVPLLKLHQFSFPPMV